MDKLAILEMFVMEGEKVVRVLVGNFLKSKTYASVAQLVEQ